MRWSNIQFPRRQTNQIVHYLVRVSKFNANQHIFYSILSRINIWLWMKAFKHPLFKKNKKNKRLGYELLFHAMQLNSLLYTIHSYNFSLNLRNYIKLNSLGKNSLPIFNLEFNLSTKFSPADKKRGCRAENMNSTSNSNICDVSSLYSYWVKIFRFFFSFFLRFHT